MVRCRSTWGWAILNAAGLSIHWPRVRPRPAEVRAYMVAEGAKLSLCAGEVVAGGFSLVYADDRGCLPSIFLEDWFAGHWLIRAEDLIMVER